VEEIETEIKTESGIVIPQAGDDRKRATAGQNVGWLVKVGSLAWSDMPAPYANCEEKVVFGKYAGTNIYDSWTDKTYKMLVDTDINAVLLEKP
jgi:co-chaperonin GroES (HSP10)